MGYIKYVIILLVFLPTIFSCSIHKRYHRKGYTITWKKNDRVKITHQRKNTSIEKTASTKKADIVQRDSIQISSERSESFSSEPEYLVNEQKILSKKELSKSKVKANFPQKLKSILLSKIAKKTSKIEFTSNNTSHKIIMINSDKSKPSYFETSESLWSAFLATLLAGLIVLLIGLLLQNAIVLIVGNIILIISGIILLIALMSIFLCIITLGMIC